MGYSCTAIARFVEEAMLNRFRHENSGNVFSVDGGKTTYFVETGREQPDGAITGTVFKMLPNGYAHRAGGYRIEPEGKITRWVGLPRKYWAEFEKAAEQKYIEIFHRIPKTA